MKIENALKTLHQKPEVVSLRVVEFFQTCEAAQTSLAGIQMEVRLVRAAPAASQSTSLSGTLLSTVSDTILLKWEF